MTTLLPLIAFIAIAITIAAIGAACLRLGRSLLPEQSRRPLVFGPLTIPLAYMFRVGGAGYETLRQELRRAGVYTTHALEEFLAIRNVLVAGWILLIVAVVIGTRPQGALALYLFAGGVVVLIALYSIPRLWLQTTGNNRVRRIQTQLPDALDMISMCMSGGMPLQPALECVAAELHFTHPDLAREFHIVHQQAESHTLSLAVEKFAERIDVDETKTLSAMIAQTERLGTNIGSALKEYADSVRRSFRQRAEEQGNKASVKMLLPVALCLAPPVYILLLAPALLEMRDFVTRENQPGGVLSQSVDDVSALGELADIQDVQ